MVAQCESLSSCWFLGACKSHETTPRLKLQAMDSLWPAPCSVGRKQTYWAGSSTFVTQAANSSSCFSFGFPFIGSRKLHCGCRTQYQDAWITRRYMMYHVTQHICTQGICPILGCPTTGINPNSPDLLFLDQPNNSNPMSLVWGLRHLKRVLHDVDPTQQDVHSLEVPNLVPDPEKQHDKDTHWHKTSWRGCRCCTKGQLPE